MNSFMASLYKQPKRAPGLSSNLPRTTPSSPQHTGSGNNTPMPGSPCHQSCPNSPRPWYEDTEEQAIFTIDRSGDPTLNNQLNGNLPEKVSASPKPKLKSTIDSKSPMAKLKSAEVSSKSPLAKIKGADSMDGGNGRKRPGEKSEAGMNDKEGDEKSKDDVRAPRKVRKKSEKESKKKTPEVQQSTVKFADIGGNEATLKVQYLLWVILWHLIILV